jgi:hypothetical protein
VDEKETFTAPDSVLDTTKRPAPVASPSTVGREPWMELLGLQVEKDN